VNQAFIRSCFVGLAVVCLALGGCRAKPVAGVHPRVVSFSPALTDMLFEMGLGDHVVGVTTQCTLPPGVDRPRVGDAFTVRAEPILAVEPDVVLTQSDSKEFETLTRIKPGIKVEHFTIERLDDIPAAVERIGELTAEPTLAAKINKEFRDTLKQVASRVRGKDRPRVLFIMGYENPSTGGAGSFIDDMIRQAGGINAAGNLSRWANLNLDAIIISKPDIIVCLLDNLENAPDAQKAKDYWLKIESLPAARSGRVYVVTDPLWTIPTPRLAKYVEKLSDIIHPSDVQSSSK